VTLASGPKFATSRARSDSNMGERMAGMEGEESDQTKNSHPGKLHHALPDCQLDRLAILLLSNDLLQFRLRQGLALSDGGCSVSVEHSGWLDAVQAWSSLVHTGNEG